MKNKVYVIKVGEMFFKDFGEDGTDPTFILPGEQDCTDGNAIDSVKIVGNIHENTSLLEAVE